MQKAIILTTIILFLSILHSTRVVFIENPPYTMSDDNNSIGFFLMESIFNRLELDFEYEYTTRLEALAMIDAEEDVIIFPFIRPINMLGDFMPLSNRILLSDTLIVITHTVFYNTKTYPDIEFNTLPDIRGHVVGSHFGYQFETSLRRAGLTIRYTHNNLESMQLLIDEEVVFVVEERIRGLLYLSQISGENKLSLRGTKQTTDFIQYKDINLFPTTFFAIAPVLNENASNVLRKINELINEEEYIDNLKRSFVER